VKSAIKTLEPTKVEITIEVEPQDFKPALDQAYRQISTQVNVPGFRKGKVPARIIDQRFGRVTVLEQAVNDGLSGWYQTALEEHKVNPMAQPEVDVAVEPDPKALEPSLTFTATVEVRPDIKIPDLAKIKIMVPDVAVGEAEVDRALDGLRHRFGSLQTIDRPAEQGDFVTLDLKAEVDGEEIDSVSGISYEIGSGRLLEGIDEALIGLSAGETTTFESPLAGGDHAGETALVTVTVNAVKERELPPLDDDFASEASEFDTLDELKQDIAKRLTSQFEQQQVLAASDGLIKHLLDTLDFPAPSGVVKADAERHLDSAGKLDSDEARAKAIEDSTIEVRTQLLMDALAQHLRVRANQGEMASFLIDTAQQYDMDPAEFIQGIEKQGEGAHFYAELVRRKAAVKALRLIQVATESGAAIDMAARLGPEQPDRPDGGPVQGTVDGEATAGAGDSLIADMGQGDVDQLDIDLGQEED